MRCDDCHGSGQELCVLIRVSHGANPGHIWWMERVSCLPCNGTGITSCCDGAVGSARDVTNQGVLLEDDI